ncbi:MAG: TonB-dependent receptor plug domain-containing protein, partial [Bacteroidales bacterium]|nr:TonB-dependent receptor plug domain-containing protein [Bacteroidales bacterium]
KRSASNSNNSFAISYRYDKDKSGKQNQMSHSYEFISRDTIIVKKDSSRKIKNVYTIIVDSTKVPTNFFIFEDGDEGDPKPLVIVDGKEDSLFVKTHNPSVIKSITVLKDAAAAALYGERAKNGVIIIATKGASREIKVSKDTIVREKPLNFLTLLQKEPKPLIVIDDEIQKNFDINSLSPDLIESVTILKDSTATKLYGEQAKNGVILIKLKSWIIIEEKKP